MSENQDLSMKDIAEELLVDSSVIRYDDSCVGWIGASFSGDTVFCWQQSTYFYSEGGYSMSSGLFTKLLEEDVKYIIVPPAESPVWVEKTDFVRESVKIEKSDSRFDDGKRPEEDQWVFPAQDPSDVDKNQHDTGEVNSISIAADSSCSQSSNVSAL